MVQQGDFEVSLVHADTREPFKEHMKDGTVYVEVEPEEEYFIRIQRTGNAVDGPLLARLAVDDKRLEHHHFFNKTIGQPTYHGLWTLNGDTWTDTALKFTKPRLVPGGKQQSQSTRLLMGKVNVEIYKGIVVDGKNKQASPSSKKSPSRTWKASSIRTSQETAGSSSLVHKKGLRSGRGSVSFIQKQRKQTTLPRRSYKRGSQVYVFTLNYCAAPGLIQAGVLPKPPVWVYHRMLLSPKKRPAIAGAGAAMDDDASPTGTNSTATTTTTTADSATCTATTTTTTTDADIQCTQIVRTHVEDLIDLTHVKDDSDDDDDDADDDADADDHNDNDEEGTLVEMNV